VGERHPLRPRRRIRVVIVRTGIVLSPEREARLARQLPLFRLGVGARLGRGSQWVSWITLVDEVAAIRRAIDDDTLHGPLNATAPGTGDESEIHECTGAALRRPAFLTVPTIALNVAPRLRNGARNSSSSSQRVRPAALEASGHRFAYPEIDGRAGVPRRVMRRVPPTAAPPLDVQPPEEAIQPFGSCPMTSGEIVIGQSLRARTAARAARGPPRSSPLTRSPWAT